jgi:monoterpene epsilon-lactone hydrolase
MLSLQARLLRFVLQHRHLLRFRLQRETFDFNTSIPGFRAEAERFTNSRLFRMPAGIEVAPVSLNGLPAEWILPAQAAKDRIILYFHGGGYVSGSCQTHRSLVAKLVKGTGVGAFLFDYRLAPEHPFPGALEDALAAYRWLLAQGVSPARIVFAGESAGGGLVLATLIAARDQGLPLPAAAVALSPWTDLTCSGESFQTKAEVCLAPKGSGPVFSKYYVGDHDPCLPEISPLYGDLQGLPPVLLIVGGDETLLDDSSRFAAKAQEAGVDVTLKVAEGMFHCYPLCAPLFPEARQAMGEICGFIKRHSGKGI